MVNGEAQLGLVGTTDGTLEALGLVVLEDDKKLQLADNLVPVVQRRDRRATTQVAEALNKLSEVLTTEDLAELNRQVDGERRRGRRRRSCLPGGAGAESAADAGRPGPPP